MAGGPDLEEEDLETLSLHVLGEEEEWSGISSSEEEDGPGPPPLECTFSFVFPYFSSRSLFWCEAVHGEKEIMGHPTITAQAGSG